MWVTDLKLTNKITGDVRGLSVKHVVSASTH